MGKKGQVEVEEPKEAKKNAKAAVKAELKALHLSHEPPAYVSESDADAVLCTLLGVSKLPALSPVVISFDGRPAAKGSIFSKTKAAHRFLHDAPEVSWSGVDEPSTLVMIDVDAPEREGDGSAMGKRAPWLHWVITDCHGRTDGEHPGRCVTDYLAPSPAIGVHRFLFVVFKGALSPDVKKLEQRIGWSATKFMEAHKLEAAAYSFIYVSSL